MKKTCSYILALVLNLFLICNAFSQAPPEVLYYKFDGTGTVVPNLASSPPLGTSNATIVGAQTQGTVGQCGGALIGTGTTTDYVNTGWVPSLNSSWSISFWTSNIPTSSTLFYIFGDPTAGSFRCFTNGVAGSGNWMLRGTGLTDIIITGGATNTPQLNTFVYNATVGVTYAYLNGVLQNTVSQAAYTLTGSGPFKVGQYGSNTGLPSAGLMDEFRFYSRALTANEVQSLVNTASVTTVASNTSVCSGYNVTLTASGANTYTWSNNTQGASVVVTPTSNSVYTVVGTTTSGCTGANTISISINPGSSASVVASPGAICSGSSAVLTATGVNSYTWSTSSNSNSITVNPSTTTNYTLNGTNSQGCISSAVITVTVNSAAPVLSIAASSGSVCLGGSLTLNATGAVSYTWSGGVTNNIPFTPSVTSTYTVNGQNGCGITTSVTSITVVPIPVSVSSTPSIACSGVPNIVTATSSATSFTWLPGNSTGTQIVVSPTASTVYTVAVSSGSCYGVALYPLNVNPVPTIAASASSTNTCAGYTITMNATGGINYTWTPGNLSGQSITITPQTSSAYSVAGSNSVGCASGAQVVVVVNPSPTITVGSSANLICSGDPVTLSAGGASTYTWNTGSNNPSINVNPTSATVYTVTGTANNCSSTQTVDVNVFIPNISISGQTVVCSGQSATLLANGANSYTWSNGLPFAGISVTPSVTTLYSVAASATSVNLTCPGTASILVTVNPNPTVTAAASRTLMCKDESNSITATGAGTYSWSSGQSTSSFAITPTLVTTFIYLVTGTDANNCSGTASVQVKVDACIGLEQYAKQNNFQIYPNPNNGSFTIHSDSETSVILINSIGEKIKIVTLSKETNYNGYINNLSKGVYYLTIEGIGEARKIIIE